MRVAYVCADRGVPVFGHKGCTVHVQEVLRALLAAGARIDLFAARLDGDAPAGLESIPVHRLPQNKKRDAADRELACIAANDDLARLLRRAGPFDMVYERYSLWSYAAMEYARDHQTPGVLEVNAPLVQEQAAYRQLIHRAEAEEVACRVFAAATFLTPVSSGVAAYLEQHRTARATVCVVPNGVNARRFRPGVTSARPAAAGVFTVGFCGHLKPWHGLPVLLEAFRMLHSRRPNTRLLVVGDGPLREEIESRLSTLGLSHAAELTGRVAAGEVPALLASMDVACAPYDCGIDCYFSPLKLYEYMACGVPVVASRIGQIAEVLEHGLTGVLCPPGDAGALAAAIEHLMDEPQRRAGLAEAARALVVERHTWDAVVERVLTLAGLGRERLISRGVERAGAPAEAVG